MSASPSSPVSPAESLGRVFVKAAIGAVAAALIAQLFLYLTHAHADPSLVVPAAGGAGFGVSGWKLMAPILAVVVIGAAMVIGFLIVVAIILIPLLACVCCL